MVSDNAVRICDKIQVVYKEMAHDGAKCNVAKWNLISRIQFKHNFLDASMMIVKDPGTNFTFGS